MTAEGRSAVRRAASAVVEQLEQRRLLAVSLVDGDSIPRWLIEGDDNPDRPNDAIVVEVNPQDTTMLRAKINGKVVGEIAIADIGIVEIRGGAGNDTITIKLPAELGLTINVFGGAGDDTLTGSDGGEWLAGEEGNDSIVGNAGDDMLEGGAGNNVVFGGRGDDEIYAEEGNDYIDGGVGHDYVQGGDGADTLLGGKGADRIAGEEGDDRINGVVGDDTLMGGAGDDTLMGKAGDDDLMGGTGNDVIEGDEGNDQIGGGAGNDQLVGDGGDDELAGQGGNDSLAGGTGDDELSGGAGADQEQGGFGDDTVVGGKGNDTLWGGDGADDLAGGAGVNAVNYEEGTDQVEWSRFDTALAEQFEEPLVKLEDPEQIRQWIVEEGVRRWKGSFGQKWYPYWWGGRYDLVGYVTVQPAGDAVLLGKNAGLVLAGNSAPASYSTTNVQERDVDEADLVKTDGEYMYLLSGSELVILDVWPAAETHVVSRTRIQGDVSGIYLEGDRVVVLSQAYDYETQEEGTVAPGELGIRLMDVCGWYSQGRPQVQVTVFDVSNRSAPVKVEESKLDGYLSQSRMIGGRLYVVMSSSVETQQPLVTKGEEEVETLRWVQEPVTATAEEIALARANPSAVVAGSLRWDFDAEGNAIRQYRAQAVTETRAYYVYETEEEYVARLGAMSVEELLPGYTTKVIEADGTEQEITGGLAREGEIYVPADSDTYNWNMFSVAMFDLGTEQAGPEAGTSVVGFNGQVYASTENLYVAGTDWWSGGWWSESRTSLYKFSLGGEGVELAASGQVPGEIINQFAMDEERQTVEGREDDFFRIATTSRSKGEQENNVFVLQEEGDDLKIVGGVTGLGRSERIYSVRFVGDKAYVVTFRQTDPLFTLDLSDPENPEAVGELKIPGYSSYLHPVGDQYLIGVGRDADGNGRVKGVQVSLFDVADLHKPKRIATYKFTGDENWWNGGNWTAAEWDHHAFSYFPDEQILTLPMLNYSAGMSVGGLEVLKVDPVTGFTSLGTVRHQGQPQRSVRVGDYLYSIGNDAVKVVELDSPGTSVAEVAMEPGWIYGRWYLRRPVVIF